MRRPGLHRGTVRGIATHGGCNGTWEITQGGTDSEPDPIWLPNTLVTGTTQGEDNRSYQKLIEECDSLVGRPIEVDVRTQIVFPLFPQPARLDGAN